MFNKLLQFEVFYQLKQRAFPIFALLFLLFGVFVGSKGFVPKGVNFNSVYQIYFHTSLFTLGSVFIIMFFAISAMLRDKQHHMEGLIFSSSITKSHYFWSRFLGTFIFSVLAFTPFILGYIFGNYASNLDPERLGDFQLLSYLQPWLYIVIPNIFICSSIIFSVSTLTKNSTATYVSAVFFYMLYFISSIYLNSPLLAQSVPASPESMAIAAVADPFGIAAFFEQTQFWTPFQKNTQLLSFSGLFLVNRVVWIVLALMLLLLTYRLFSFRKITKKIKKEGNVSNKKAKSIGYKPISAIHNFKAHKLAYYSLVKLELKSVFKSLPFIAVLIMWLTIVFSELYATAVSGGEYGVSLYPYTNQLIDLITQPLTIFSLILIIYYSADMVWKERSFNVNLIIDATPITNSVFFLSKFTALILLPLILITSGVLMCVLFQIGLGYSNFEFHLYASLYYHYGLQLLIFCMIALFINGFAKNKFMGMGIFGFIVLLSLKSDTLGLEHPLTSIGFMPRVSYSNMNGFFGGVLLYNHLAVYWLALGLLVTVLSFKIWNRGTVASFKAKIHQLLSGWGKSQKLTIMLLVMSVVGAGSVIYYNINVVTEYTTVNDKLDFSEGYERQYKTYESLDRPYSISRKTDVAIFPDEKRYTIEAHYILKNGSDKPLTQVLVTERLPLTDIHLERAKLVKHDADYGVYLFEFNKPLQPNDTIVYTYRLRYQLKGYEEDRAIVDNGSYIRHRDFEPMLGYSLGLEITSNIERKKRNLPERETVDNTDAHIVLEDFKNEKIAFETIVSTKKGHTALSSGKLLKSWSENNRNYFHYKSKGRTLPTIAYFSADYDSKKTTHNGITIEQYFDKNHQMNIEAVEQSIKQTLEYCQQHFGTYKFDHIKIAEIPSHWSFGGYAHPGIISMVEDRLYLTDVSDPNTFNLVAKRAIHEVAHQWWGHTLSAKPVAGGTLFVEGLAKYTEAVIMEKMYGKRALYELSEDARRKYFTHRTYAEEVEPPVYKVEGQAYISYGKALTVMLALRDIIGEDQVNRVLRTLTDRSRNSNKLEITSIDFLNEVYKVTPTTYHELVNDWFKKVITYDLEIKDASYTKQQDGSYQVTVTVKAQRFETANNGEIQPIAINEPIKIAVLTEHPSHVKNDRAVLYYESKQINKELTEFKITAGDKPNYISIDPFGTRSDENLTDNTVRLN